MNKLFIRKVQVSDAEYISLLGRITFNETFGHYFRDPLDLLNYHENTFSVAKIRKSISDPYNVFWLAFIDELPVAYAKIKIDSPTEFTQLENASQLQKIYILKDFQAMKIGQEILNVILNECINQKGNYLWLSVLKENERAFAFYTKNNFRKIGEHSYSIGKEDFGFYVMGRELGKDNK